MSFSTKKVCGRYFELTKKIAKLEQIIFKILKKLKLDCLCSSSSSCSFSFSSELEIIDNVSFIDNFENRIKSIEDDSQKYLLKGPYEEEIQTYVPTVPKTFSGYLNREANPTT
jgi:hypothetical protein